MGNELYLDDAYLKEFEAVVNIVKDGKYVVLDKTAFYPIGGGQPYDTGKIFKDDMEFNVVYVGKFDGKISHEVDKLGLKEGDNVKCMIDWGRRYKLMRMHSAAHVLAGVFSNEYKAMITGGNLDLEKSRFDFNLETMDREKVEQAFAKANEIIKKDFKIEVYSLDRKEAMKDESLFKLAAGFKHDFKEIRIVDIKNFDRQADGGTHVQSLKEIGKIELVKMENKGKGRKRVYFTITP
jgi:misacylated tRNA(Ala) deacylase